MKVLISLTAHENIEVIIDKCKNIVHLFKDPIIIVHINKLNNINLSDLYSYASKINSNLHINDRSIEIVHGDGRLIYAHFLNYKFAELRKIKFDYFIFDASNTLCVKFNVEEYIKKFPICVNFNRYDSSIAWPHHSKLINDNVLQSLGFKQLYISQHEGIVLNSDICIDFFEFFSNHYDFNYGYHYPTEEIWLPTILHKFVIEKGLESSLGKQITYMNWRTNLNISVEELNKVFNKEYSNYFFVKRIQRELNDPIRSLIRNLLNY